MRVILFVSRQAAGTAKLVPNQFAYQFNCLIRRISKMLSPRGKFKQDLIVLLDGKRSSGKVTFKSVKFYVGTVVQNGKEMSVKDVAYIKFTHPKALFESKKPAQK
jgi:hypothetical protein